MMYKPKRTQHINRFIWAVFKVQLFTQPKAKGRLFPVPKGIVAIGGG